MIDPSVLERFAGKQVLVTGGTGMIGRQVIRLLGEAGAAVTTVSLDPGINGFRHFRESLDNFQRVRWLTGTYGKDYVFHLAGKKGSVKATQEKAADYFVPLLQMNTNVLEAARLSGVKKLVYTSSIGAYGAPKNEGDLHAYLEEKWWEDQDGLLPPMDLFPGWAKRMGELQIRSYTLQYGMTNFVPVRMTACYGPGDNFASEDAMVITSLLGKLHRGARHLKVWGDGSAVRDWLYSRDAAEGIILAAAKGVGPGFYNIGSGFGASVKDLVEMLQKVAPFTYEFDAAAPSGFSRRVLDITRARGELGFNPITSLEQGLKETWESMR